MRKKTYDQKKKKEKKERIFLLFLQGLIATLPLYVAVGFCSPEPPLLKHGDPF